jgi:hypothetical protein
MTKISTAHFLKIISQDTTCHSHINKRSFWLNLLFNGLGRLDFHHVLLLHPKFSKRLEKKKLLTGYLKKPEIQPLMPISGQTRLSVIKGQPNEKFQR